MKLCVYVCVSNINLVMIFLNFFGGGTGFHYGVLASLPMPLEC